MKGEIPFHCTHLQLLNLKRHSPLPPSRESSLLNQGRSSETLVRPEHPGYASWPGHRERCISRRVVPL